MSGPPRPAVRDDAGFTLIELVVTVVVLGLIIAPLTAVVLTYLKNTDATTARMSESHDAQLATAYFAQDVATLGVRGAYATTAEPALVPSIETGAPAAGGLYPCGAAGTPAAVVRFASDDYTGTSPASRVLTVVSYVVDGSELHRVRCAGTAAPVDVVIAHDLVAPYAAVGCADATGSPVSCTGAAVPHTVSLTLTIQDPDSAGGPYQVTLTGQRRQT